MDTGETRRDVGIERVLYNTPTDYEKAFSTRFHELLYARITFTSEDIVKKVGYPPNHHNAIGALMNRYVSTAKAAGLIELTGWKTAEHKEGHSRAIRVYQGLKP